MRMIYALSFPTFCDMLRGIGLGIYNELHVVQKQLTVINNTARNTTQTLKQL